MSSHIAKTLAIALVGIEGHLVEVESHVGRGLVSYTLVGLPDASLRESKERVRSALQSCNLDVPDRKVTVNLSPAGLPKSGSAFDVAIALSVLIANRQVRARPFEGCVLLGELALDGSLRPVTGILPALMAAADRGIERAIVPAGNEQEAALVPGIEVRGFAHVAEIIRWAGGKADMPLSESSAAVPIRDGGSTSLADTRPLDLADVRGQGRGRRALEVAAAGGHHIHFVGEPGAGKTMLGLRLPSILPDLDDRTALTTTAIHSVAGLLGADGGLVRRPPICTPHHSMTMPAMIGGGSQLPRPGAVSLAHGGVLLLDEAPEFAPSVLDALRQPLEEGHVSIHRARGHTSYPARFQLVLASNPCPCGHSGARVKQCTCSSIERRRYQARLSGPLRDRIDITVPMRTPTRADLAEGSVEESAVVKERVAQARERMRARLEGTPWRLNTELPGTWIRRNTPLPADLLRSLDDSIERGILSMRGADRVLRLMWTLADLDGRDQPDMADMGEALALRSGGGHEYA
ncbi:YifB family Mg chelatase-like AAA ATPase [Schaalia sp. Marseille-Q2122]|uniref:YifB family Mg chelatase-like AAA ATPase n=1 Tax=Schaalia sp. Marseille-Q2122 TaxID=2736604 RepID=UPI00158A53CD|nr:YifB family Mg chelatase-like AAA ATPase [Schaalia sp. Marseille-Q2122]